MASRRGIVARDRDLAVISEGAVRLKVIGSDADGHRLALSIDYSKVETPLRSYYADYCDVEESRAAVGLIFGKLLSSGTKLRNKVEISFPRKMFAEQLWKSSRDFEKTIKRLAAQYDKLPDASGVEDTDTVQTFHSNNVFMATSDEEAVLDFYYVSPGDIHFAAQGKNSKAIAVEPVLRVLVETALMEDFLNKCRPQAEKWAEHYGIQLEGE